MRNDRNFNKTGVENHHWIGTKEADSPGLKHAWKEMVRRHNRNRAKAHIKDSIESNKETHHAG